jgi:cytochrome d ubiquinol oxidase subunit II
MAAPFRDNPALFVVPVLLVLAIANIPREITHGREFRGFLSSCVTIVLLMATFGLGMFPEMIHSTTGTSLTAFNAASSETTLTVMLIIAAIGMPLVIGYTSTIYWVFRGKVKLDEMSY